MIQPQEIIPSDTVSRLELDLRCGKRQLRHIHKVTNAINENVSVADLYRMFQEILTGELGTEQISLFVFDHTWKAVLKENSSDTNGINFTIATSYLEPSEIRQEDRAALGAYRYIVPVLHKTRHISFALLGALEEERPEEVDELLTYVQVITSIITVAIENKRLFKREVEKKQFDKELELASKVQNMLIPRKLPKNHFYEFSGLYLPHKSIGGDYYDVINVNKDEFVFCIGDISGKGIAAALVMANLQAYLNASLSFKLENSRSFIDQLNSKVFSITNGDNFITLFIGKYNIITRELHYINAGHNPPILLNGGEVQYLNKGCTLLGVFEEIPRVETGVVILQPGATIVTYTDGLTELEDEEGALYSIERLEVFTKRHHHFSAEVFLKILYDAISKFKGECLFNDDVSALVGKFY
jgi:phosphoserine phosphatase RsbU/P